MSDIFSIGSQELLEEDPLQWYREMAKYRGALLRHFLEHGVSWAEIQGWVKLLSKNKKDCQNVAMAPRRYVWKLTLEEYEKFREELLKGRDKSNAER
jgi:hypothetical protein